MFYYFTKTLTEPTHQFTKLQWEDIYNNFRIFWSVNGNKRKRLTDIIDDASESEDDENLRKNSTKKILKSIQTVRS